MMKLYPIFITIFLITYTQNSFSQCSSNVPVVNVDLTGNPDSVWLSPNIIRDGNCCGTTPPDRCVKFIITLDPGAVAINFSIASGAVPGGAMFYQINCGPQQAVGSPICLDGVGPHILTFCKPGNNNNTYQITSIPAATSGTDIVINDGCTGNLSVSGLTPGTITWNSIFPGSLGQYNGYLSCPTCTTTNVTAQVGYPPYIDYVVCGTPIAVCSTPTMCDTVRVTFNPTLFATILPQTPTVCFGQTNTVLTAQGIGGTPPYSYQWNTGATTPNITVGVGNYSVIVSDSSGCPPTSTAVVVTAFANPITANAGSDLFVCSTNPTVTLSGSVTGVTTGIWSGGGGSFLPNNTTLNATYTPSASELTAGSATLILTTTNNGSCPAASDTITINYTTFNAVINTSLTHVNCNGGTDGSVTANAVGSFGPFTYSWNTTPVQTTSTVNGLPAGTYTVIVTDANSCTSSQDVTITQPFPLASVITSNNVACNGGSSGSADVNVFGGTLPYSYLWSPSGSTLSNAINLSNGTHIVSITDGNGCVHGDTIIISQPPSLTLSISNTPVLCYDGNSGTATASVGGGTPPYVFNWSPSGVTTQTALNLTAGNYSLLVTDNNGCTIIANTTITQPPKLYATASVSPVSCFGGNDGFITMSPNGGSPSYNYSINPGGVVTNPINNLSAGNYTVSTFDANNCRYDTIITISEPALLTSFISMSQNISCFGGSNGMAAVSVNGGTAPYNYVWSPSGGNGSTASGLTAGNYSVSVTDSRGCVTVASIIITEPSAPLSASTLDTDVSCFGGSDGSSVATASGGTSPYNFIWSPGSVSGSNLNSVIAGTYTLYVTDANGCFFTTTATINQPPQIIVTTSVINSNCGQADGSTSAVVSGGTSPYNYLWNPSGATTASITNVVAGFYQVTVTDAQGCQETSYANLDDNAGPTVTIFAITNVSCNAGSDGSVTVSVSGGAGGYTYNWIPTGGNGPTANGLTAGQYTAVVTDAVGCVASVTTSPIVSEPPIIDAFMSSTSTSCFGSNDGTATVLASGGTPGYTYLWSDGQTTSTAVGLISGNYSVTITDNNNCVLIAFVFVPEPPEIQMSVVSVTDVNCFAGSDGSGTVSAIGGVPGYIFNWTPNGSTSANATGLSAGNYNVTATDVNGCVASINVTINQPATYPSVSLTTTPVSCNGGSNGTATANPVGGTPGYTYVWSPMGGSNSIATNLTSGNYTVTVTDSRGCQASSIGTVTEPAVMSGTFVSSNSTCGNNNGTASVQISGGTSPYTYAWSPSGGTNSSTSGLPQGNYSVLVTDNNSCSITVVGQINNTPGPNLSNGGVTQPSCFGGNNGTATVNVSNGTAPFQYVWLPYGGITSTATGLIAGNYSVTVTDNNGCQVSLPFVINQPPALVPSVASFINVSCFGGNNGEISTTTVGGTGTYTYSWSPSGGITPNATNLSANNYTLNVTDQNGCMSSINQTLTQPSLLTSSISAFSDPLCFGGNTGSATVSAGGGTLNYTYAWSTNPVQTSITATGLVAGSYSVLVTDQNGCTSVSVVTLNQPSQVNATISPNDTICGGQSTTIVTGVSGGVAPYFYIWSPNVSFSSSAIVSPVSSTNYNVIVYDNNGCPSNPLSTTIQVYYLNGANIIVDGNSPICPGTISTVYATVTGANVGPVSYQWNNNLGTGPGAFTVSPTVPTYYTVTVTNSCGASYSDSVLVDISPPPTVNISSDVMNGCVPLMVQFTDNSITNTNDSIYSWYWQFGDGNVSYAQDPTYVYTNVGSFNVTLAVQTYGGCVGSSAGSNYIIDVYPVPVANFTVNSNSLFLPNDVLVCTNLSTGAILNNWTFGDGGTSADINPTYSYQNLGTFPVTLIVANQYGCTDTASTLITTSTSVIFPNVFTPNTSGPNGGTYSIGDLTNDVFFPYTMGVDKFKLQIFNRWGELIFESNDVKIGWDGYYRGELCQLGVYVWKAEIILEDGKKFSKVGDVTLLR